MTDPRPDGQFSQWLHDADGFEDFNKAEFRELVAEAFFHTAGDDSVSTGDVVVDAIISAIDRLPPELGAKAREWLVEQASEEDEE